MTRAVRHSATLLLALALTGGLPGCALFKPTEPEPPSGGVVDVDYSDPDATLQTLDLAIEDKGRTTGQNAYLDGLTSPERDGLELTVVHLPSVEQELRNQQVTIPPSWSHSLESAFYQKLITIDSGPYSMRWETDSSFVAEDQTGEQDAVRNKVYIIQTQTGLLARGYAKLTFKQTAPRRWVITTWEERDVRPGDSEDHTFSMLRLKP